jgi:methionine aminopeptidase
MSIETEQELAALRARSAHAEHTIVITRGQPLVLTAA